MKNAYLMGVPQMLQIGILAPVATCCFICPRPRLGAGFDPEPAFMATPDCTIPVEEAVVVLLLTFHVWALVLLCTGLRGLGLVCGATFTPGVGLVAP